MTLTDLRLFRLSLHAVTRMTNNRGKALVNGEIGDSIASAIIAVIRK